MNSVDCLLVRINESGESVGKICGGSRERILDGDAADIVEHSGEFVPPAGF